MTSFKFNQISMAILGTVFILMSLTFLSEGIFHAEVPEKKGYLIEVAETTTAAGGEAASGPAFEPISSLLKTANIEAGAKVFKKCAACHTVDEGGKNKAGPALWDIVNRPMAKHDGFKYSSALTGFGADKQWTYEELNGFLWKPKTYVKGTAMGFVGLKKVEDRANVVAYLRSLAGTPAPLPE